MPVARLERVPLRDVWAHEAHDFTVWLEENIDILNEATGLDLVSANREQRAGAFSVDLVAVDSNGVPVVIENQLEQSDHDHLGKLLTYTAAYETTKSIWIVSHPRPEHIKAVTWLNDRMSESFFLLKVDAVRIGDSDPAPMLQLIVGPSIEAKEIAAQRRDLSSENELRKQFWTELLARAAPITNLHQRMNPIAGRYFDIRTRHPGITYSYSLGKSCQVYLAIGLKDREENDRIFDRLHLHKSEIEQRFQRELDWSRWENKNHNSIVVELVRDFDLSDQESWSPVQQLLVDTMIKFHAAINDELEQAVADVQY